MDYRELKQAVQKIEIPDEMEERIIRNCHAIADNRTEVVPMQTKHIIFFKRPYAVAAIIVLCLCICTGVMAISRSGIWNDKTNLFGTIIGQEYDNATEEITVIAEPEGNTIMVHLTLNTPDVAPFAFIEQIGIGSYSIIDENGKTICKNEKATSCEIKDCEVQIPVSTEGLETGKYTLTIDQLTGESKADQPLPISGNWVCEFNLG